MEINMNAIKRGKIYSRQRVNLESVIPLKVPYSIQIDICSVCNLRCRFCVHSDTDAVKKAGVRFGMMSYELFTAIIDDMRKSWMGEKVKKLRLFQIGEPLLHPDICRMIKYAKEADVAENIELTTNGTRLKPSMNIGLVEAGLDILNISVNGINEKQYREVCDYDIDFDDYVKNIEHFYQNRGPCKLFIKYGDIGYTEEKEEFYRIFGSICDEIFVEAISATMWQDTDVDKKVKNLHKGLYGQELGDKKVCPFLFTTMIINDQGIAHLCCIDWKNEIVLGDLKKESIGNIWNGEKLRQFQITHLKKMKDSIPLCRNCESLSGNNIDDIDDYAEELLERITNLKLQ
jgi:MoaA/NifB/PqqE/SkfB family radical SAM enzyme